MLRNGLLMKVSAAFGVALLMLSLTAFLSPANACAACAGTCPGSSPHLQLGCNNYICVEAVTCRSCNCYTDASGMACECKK